MTKDKRPTVSSDLQKDIASFYADPLGYVMYALPWGQKGKRLEKETGPDDWQIDILNTLKHEITRREQASEEELKTIQSVIQIAVASGHGIGKTALVSWIILWFMSTRMDPQVVVTASTQAQLLKKTWRELAKWQKLAINGHWFEWTQTAFTYKKSPETWFASAIPWSENNSEAFAGTHEEHVLMLFDEGSGIADKIYEVASGALSTGKGVIWMVFGNPTKNTGFFRECFRKFKHRWITRQIDSRTAKKADASYMNELIADYGIDSDFVKIRVLGQFPDAADNQFYSNALVEKCMSLKLPEEAYSKFPVIMGVDVARYGSDKTVITIRQQRKIHAVYIYQGLSIVETKNKVVGFFYQHNVDVIFTDDTGVGGGVTDMLRDQKFPVIGVIFGGSADDPVKYFNKRSECFGILRLCMERGMELPRNDQLKTEMTSIGYGFTKTGALQMESKLDFKKRGLDSPDILDSIAIGFAFPVAQKNNLGKFRKTEENGLEHNGKNFRRQSEVSNINNRRLFSYGRQRR